MKKEMEDDRKEQMAQKIKIKIISIKKFINKKN